MSLNLPSPDHLSDDDDSSGSFSVSSIGLSFRNLSDRFRRNPNPTASSTTEAETSYDRQHRSSNRSGSQTPKRFSFLFRRNSCLYISLLVAVFFFTVSCMVLQSSITSLLFRNGRERGRIERLQFGSSLEFLPRGRSFEFKGSVDRLRREIRVGVRPPRLGLILGNMKKDPRSLMLFTVIKNLQGLGYMFKIYAIKGGVARSTWEKIGGQVSILSPKRYGHIDWSIFEGVIADSLEAKDAISSLMQEPFCSVPLIWIIHEDILASRLPVYESMGWDHLISYWKTAFSRADVVLFPDYSLPMLYGLLDTGNFFVVPGSPIDVWAAESYIKTHSKSQLRKDNGFSKDDMLVVVVGSSFFYNELSWEYAVAMHDIGPLLSKYGREEDVRGSFKFVLLCGNSSNGYDNALQEIATHLGLHNGSLRHYGISADVNGLLLMADIVLYGSSQDEQGFPPLLTRAMTFGIPVIAPDYPVIKKYIIDGVHGMIFPRHKPEELTRAFSVLISKMKLSKFVHFVTSSGRLLAKNMLASECIAGYAWLLENLLSFPSDALLPSNISQLKRAAWEWSWFWKDIEQKTGDEGNLDLHGTYPSIVYDLEKDMVNLITLTNISQTESETLVEDFPSELDWDTLREIERSEEVERLEMEQIDERMEKDLGVWDDVYRNARKAEKSKFEINERDEGELERTGQPLCIYEIYNGVGAWPFLHHGSLYRGLSLSSKAQRLRSDDVDASGRLLLLNDTYYRDILCEIGGMFSIAKGVDKIHKRPWIGFQSWRAAGRKVSLSSKAVQILEETIQLETKGDVVYFWVHLDISGELTGGNDVLTFWSMCDILNGGHCRSAFEDAFRQMYSLPSSVKALPPMPEDGGHWSALHSWVMPTTSFLEFIMFSRMFADSLNNLHMNSSKTTHCVLGSSILEKKHCYCRVLELLVNVWAYHSARTMVYIDPYYGVLEEQHPIEQRKGFMWAKYFNVTLLKIMDEDLAEAADDNDNPNDSWLWPLTGEVYGHGIYEKEREERYRQKIEKKRRMKAKLHKRMKRGYKQKSLGG